MQPTSSYSGDFPAGLIIVNGDLSGNGNLVSRGGSGIGTTGVGGTVTLSANRSSPATVATIVSSLSGNDIGIYCEEFVMGPNEAFTCLGNLTLAASNLTLGDLVSLNDLSLLAMNTDLLLHGDESLLASTGFLYTSPTLHFLAGGTYLQVGTLTPATGPLNAQELGLSSSEFKPQLIYNNHILNFDTSPKPIPFSVSVSSRQYLMYQLLIADAQLSDLLPIFYPRIFHSHELKSKKSE